MKISAEKAEELVTKLLTNMGLTQDDAEIVSEITINADIKGFGSHGIGRFPQYIIGIDSGNINLDTEIEIEKETISTALLNGHNAFGQLVAYNAMNLAINKAQETGIGIVGVHDSNHFGVTGYYADMAMENDMIGIVIANTAPAVAPLNGTKPILGTNPIAITIPAHNDYIATDMATSISSRGKLLEAKRKNEQIPEGVALDKNGQPTTNPEEALEGSLLSFGAHKGFALAFMIEILTGPLVQAAFGSAVQGTADPTKKCNKGDMFIAIDISKFVDINQFKDDVDELVKELRASGDNIIVPGDIERNNIQKYLKEGIEIDTTLYDTLKGICENHKINIDEYLI